MRGGTEEGTVDAVVRVTDENPLKFSVTVDNSGTAETGLFRVGFGIQHSNLWNRDHVISGQYVMAPHKWDHPHFVNWLPNPRVFIIGGAYKIPLYGFGDFIEFSGGYFNVKSGVVTGLFGQFNVAGAETVLGAHYNRNLPRIGELEHRVAFGLDWRAYNNRTTTVIGNATVLPDVTVHPISVTYSGIYRTSVSETNFNFSGLKNLPGGNDAHTKVFDAFRPDAAPGYTIWLFGVGYNHAFASDWQGRFSFSGQLTRNRLISGEQFGLGGADSVRGFFEREIASDSGYRGSLEAYSFDLAGKVDWLAGFRLRGVLFYDWGQIWGFFVQNCALNGGFAMAGPANVSTLLLRNVPLFSVLPESQLALLTSAVSRKSYPRGTTIISAGESTDSLYVVISGRLKVMMSDDEGREVILALLGPNEFFGEMGLLDDSPRSATVMTVEACELLLLSKKDFKKCLQENFEMAMTVMRGLVKRLRKADQKIGSLALMDVYGRVARLLLEMSDTIEGQKVVTKKLAKQDIAKMIGASREMVSRVMKDLQTGGFIEVRPGAIYVRDTILTVE